MFIDYSRVRVKAGNGGNGCCSFRHEKFVPHGGPDGGNGGKGGDVIAVGDRNINTLLYYRYKKLFKAKNGMHGKGKNLFGRKAEDIIIRLPIGTEIYEINENKKRIRKFTEIVKDKQRIILARGGKGGRGNAQFASSTNQAPRKCEQGKQGEEKYLELVLKLLADVGLVGFPNAGKSTLISAISSAHPKIAEYKFTTLEPVLGVVKLNDFTSFVMADIPGIIENAHIGKGLGLQFLKHIQKAKVLLFLIDITDENPLNKYETLKKELHLYDHKLDQKKFLIGISKADLISKQEYSKRITSLKAIFKNKVNEEPLIISAVTGFNIDKLKDRLYKLLQSSA